MTLIQADLNEVVNNGRVKRKSNKAKKLKATAKRITGGASEVMVKITSFGKGVQHVKAHLNYITRNGKLEMEDDRGQRLEGTKDVKNFFEKWEKDFKRDKRHKEQRDTMHMVLSMPETVDSESVKNATRQFAKDNFGNNHEYVFVLHTDQPQPHCHLTVKCKGRDGNRLNPRKADLQRWRDGFAEKLREQGVDAESTPRGSRGVVKKAVANIIKNIELGDKTHKPRVPKIKAKKIKEVVTEILNEEKVGPAPPKPWEEAISSSQQIIRRAWLKYADELEKETPSITFNKKGAFNERPDYERIDRNREREGQRAAALYQSNIEKNGCRTSPGTITSLRNVSAINMVQHEQASQMLLRKNALNSLGRLRAADPEMRRERISDRSDVGSERKMNINEESENLLLAKNIRDFVANMPSIETERDQIKAELRHKFTKQPERQVNQDMQPQAKEQRIGVEQPSVKPLSKPTQDKDIEV